MYGRRRRRKRSHQANDAVVIIIEVVGLGLMNNPEIFWFFRSLPMEAKNTKGKKH